MYELARAKGFAEVKEGMIEPMFYQQATGTYYLKALKVSNSFQTILNLLLKSVI